MSAKSEPKATEPKATEAFSVQIEKRPSAGGPLWRVGVLRMTADGKRTAKWSEWKPQELFYPDLVEARKEEIAFVFGGLGVTGVHLAKRAAQGA